MGTRIPTGYRESIDYLYGLQKHGIKFGLNSTVNILARLGDPQQKYRCIHVAGTNGKGSTASVLSEVLRAHGHRVGLYTSPHLVRFTERFLVDGKEVPPTAIMDVFQRVRAEIDDSFPPTFFEIVTAMAFQYFADEAIDWAIVEVGMGGRLDATNVINPEVSIITNVGYDHQEYLGSTLSSITREKAGIVKDGVPVVTGIRQPLALGILKTICMRKKAPLRILGKDFRVRRAEGQLFQYSGTGTRKWPSLRTPLLGTHQLSNAAVALAALEEIDFRGLAGLDGRSVQLGLSSVKWPARLEVLQERPMIVLDGAHNSPGAESLRQALKDTFKYRKLHLVIGIMADKDLRGILSRLLPLAETAIFTRPRYTRAADPESLKKLARPYIQKQYVIAEPAAAIEQARSMAGPEDLICITGSLYFAGEVKELFGEPASELI